MSKIEKAARSFAGEVTGRAFSAAHSIAPDPRTKKYLVNARRALKVLSLVPHVVGSRLRLSEDPFIIHHWITLRCNCFCESCMWKNNSAAEMTTTEIKRFYDQAADQGFGGILFTGGEPLLRKDMPEIYRYAKRKCGLKIGAATNGFFLEKRVDEFGDYIDALLVSIDSVDPEKHDRIRGVPGLFDRLVRGIEKTRKKYPFIHLFVNSCLDDNSVDEAEDIIRLASDLGVPVTFDVISTVQHTAEDGAVDRKGYLISSYEKISEALHKVREAKKRGASVFNSEHYLAHFDRGKVPYRCRYPRVFLRVMSGGDVEDCLRIDQPIANLRTTPLKKILKMNRMKTLRNDAEKCWTCSSPTMVDCSYFWDNPLELLSEFAP
ncbi:MAG: radical SAM protein [bacterium]